MFLNTSSYRALPICNDRNGFLSLLESFIFVLFSPFQLGRGDEYCMNTTCSLCWLKLILHTRKTRRQVIELHWLTYSECDAELADTLLAACQKTSFNNIIGIKERRVIFLLAKVFQPIFVSNLVFRILSIIRSAKMICHTIYSNSCPFCYKWTSYIHMLSMIGKRKYLVF